MSDAKRPDASEAKPPATTQTVQVSIKRAVQEALVDVVPANQQKRILDKLAPKLASMTLSIEKYHSGPLPSVETAQGYELAAPGSFARIVAMAEKEQDAIIAAAAYQAKKDSLYRGLCLLAGVAALAGLLSAIVYLASLGQAAVAIAVVGIGCVGLVSAFINAHWRPSK